LEYLVKLPISMKKKNVKNKNGVYSGFVRNPLAVISITSTSFKFPIISSSSYENLDS